jgi:succinate dehydrogenase / fumarate reductase, cytochrome b subunit
MNALLAIWRSSLGRKYVMALSGACMFLFVIGHMVGNLQFFLPPHYLNQYAHFLQSTPELLWPVRLGMLACIGLHIAAALSLTVQNRAARPDRYAGGDSYAATLASRTMIYSGLVITAFVIFHLLHYTVMISALNGVGVDFSILEEPKTGYHDVYAMVIFGFQNQFVAIFYIVAVGLLCLHLGHGIAAMFQSLGLRNHVWGPRIAGFARVASMLLFLGYAAVPLSVLLGRGSEYTNQVTTHVNAPPTSHKPH